MLTLQERIDQIMKATKVFQLPGAPKRLTRVKYKELKESFDTIKLDDLYQWIYDLRLAILQRDECYKATNDFIDFIEVFVKEDAKTTKYFQSDFMKVFENICTTFFSYYYNVPFDNIEELKYLDAEKEGRNIFIVLSYPELEHIINMKKTFMKEVKAQKITSEYELYRYAQQIAQGYRNEFKKEYKLDPIIVEKSQINTEECRAICEEFEEALRKRNLSKAYKIQQAQKEAQSNAELEKLINESMDNVK